jgi:hypothetical protein
MTPQVSARGLILEPPSTSDLTGPSAQSTASVSSNNVSARAVSDV